MFVIKQVLRGCGLDHHVHVASDGQEALRYLEQVADDAAPALVLLDLNIPKIPGIDVLRRLRAESKYQPPVIIVTSSASDADRIAAQNSGAQAYFQKPNDLAAYMELADVIKRILGT